MFKIFVVYQNQDMTEGRGPMLPVAAFQKGNDAVAYARTIEPYGADVRLTTTTRSKEYACGQFTSVKAMPVFETFEDKIAIDTELKRIEALNKLTPEERKILGLE